MDFDPKKLRARFAKLTKDHDAIEKRAAPLRKAYDVLCQENRKAEDAAADKIKRTTEGLFDIEQERAAIARALGGKTGEA